MGLVIRISFPSPSLESCLSNSSNSPSPALCLSPPGTVFPECKTPERPKKFLSPATSCPMWECPFGGRWERASPRGGCCELGCLAPTTSSLTHSQAHAPRRYGKWLRPLEFSESRCGSRTQQLQDEFEGPRPCFSIPRCALCFACLSVGWLGLFSVRDGRHEGTGDVPSRQYLSARSLTELCRLRFHVVLGFLLGHCYSLQ